MERKITMVESYRYDPVFVDNTNGKFYFFDETWAYDHGPYDTEEEARAQLVKYCHEVLGV